MKIKGTKFPNYNAMKAAVKSNEYSFTYHRAPAYKLSIMKNKALALLRPLVLLLPVIFIIYQAVTKGTYLLLLSIILLFVMFILGDRLKITTLLAALLIIISIITSTYSWYYDISVSVLILYAANELWWGITTYYAGQLLLEDQETFFEVWETRGIGLKDKEGKTYIFEKNK
jgi:predicted membrane protein